ncbi:O-methyltransferase [Sinosporangium album]|uniref:O-methyltransferase n=1 Tax=Sinosporangium album TaxID=504805 RepID=A0A1G7VCM5_9ACTN|nr:methyltransferase [Sinosporangium album]SDG57504.1 O-methyltransferase [Sinosporangium album]
MNSDVDPVWDAVSNLSRFASLSVAAELGCADHLAEGPLPVTELADRCGAHAPSLRRVMRHLASFGVVKRTSTDVYALTEHGTALRSGVPGSRRAAVRMLAEPAFWYSLGMLPNTVKHGRSAFVQRYGPLYRYLAENPLSGRLFDDYMRARAVPFTEGLPRCYDFSGVGSMVDVAGGQGHLLAAVLRANPGMRGVLFELPSVIPGAREALAAEGLAGRVEFTAGDYFDGVPPGADAYLLAAVIHNWDDGDATRILSNVRRAMRDASRLLILEFVLPDDDSPHRGKDVDMRMLALFGDGTERTRSEYGALLDKAGLSLCRVIDLPGEAALIEAVPA